MEIIGVIKSFTQIESFNTKKGQMKKCSVIIEESAQYPNSMVIDLFNEKTEYVSQFAVGEMVRCTFNAHAREWNGKMFNSVSMHKMEKLQQHQPQQQTAPTTLF